MNVPEVSQRPLSLLVVNWQDRLNPRAGGAELHLHEIFGRLAARGHAVTLLASGWSGAPARATVDGIEVHRVGSRNGFILRAEPYYKRVLASRPFDFLIEDLNKVPLHATRWARSPVVLLVHHLFGATAFQSATPPVAALTWLLERPIPRWYQGIPVEAVSESTADDLVRRGLRRTDITVIRNGVDLEFFTPDVAVGREPAPAFLYLGRLQSYKRVDLIVRSVARAIGDGVAMDLVIAGAGPADAALRRLAGQLGIGNRVHFTGRVSEEAKRDLFRRAWANVFTSPKEGWGITVMEAAACGTPTVASDSPGLRDAVVHGETGLLVPHGSVPALAAALQSLATSPARVAALGAGALAYASRHGWERAADETERHLLELRRGRRKEER